MSPIDAWCGVVPHVQYESKVKCVCVCMFLTSKIQTAVCSVALYDRLTQILNRGYLRQLRHTFASTFTCDMKS